ncbi:MAG: diguanylate cyclase, partial [Mariprofundaceae bacterium]|nr:diguanylate cyclase [Mariprofundaceae bacterium]
MKRLKRLKEDPSRIVILGGGRGGAAMLELMFDEPLTEVVAVVDHNDDALGIVLAKAKGIPIYTDVEEALIASAPCVAFNLTNNEMVEEIASSVVGAGGVIGGLEARLIWRMVTDLKETKKDLEYQATHDPLTGLYNRRYVMDQLSRELSQAIRYKFDCSLVLIDLDFFKRVNDCHGHIAGDLVLKQISRQLQQSVRTADVLGRWGGEEFLVLLPHTSAAAARLATRQWLKCVQETPVILTSGEALGISFSAGVVGLSVDDGGDGGDVQQHIEALLETVDHRLYEAKDSGRACV